MLHGKEVMKMVAFEGDDKRYNDWYSGTNQYRQKVRSLTIF